MSAQIAVMLMMIAASVQIGNAAMKANWTIVFSMRSRTPVARAQVFRAKMPSPTSRLDDADDQEERAPGRVVGKEEPALRDREVVVLEEGDEALQDVERTEDHEERAAERVPPAGELAGAALRVLSMRRHLSLL